QVPDDEEVRVAAAGWIGGEPVDKGLSRGPASLATISLTIAKIRVSNIITVGALRFQVIDYDCKACASGIDLKGLRQRWTALGINEARVHSCGKQLEISDRCDNRRPID